MIIADDDVLLREGLAGLLDRSGMHVLGQAGDARQLLDLVDEHLPDLVLVDIRMPPTRTTETLAAARTIRETHPQVGIVVLSAHVAVEHAMELLASGGPAVVSELVAAVAAGPARVLSAREREVLGLGLMADGRSNAGIAQSLGAQEHAGQGGRVALLMAFPRSIPPAHQLGIESPRD